jgi:hypothetical protein
VSFPAADLKRLLDLPDRVVLLAEGDLRVLLAMLRTVDARETVIVSQDMADLLNLSWVDPAGECNEPLSITSAAALLTLGIPVVADPATWDLIQRVSSLPVVRARARMNLDGFIEIVTPVAQHVEALAVRGLFRIDDSRFGVPLACLDQVEGIPGLRWDGPRPTIDLTTPRLRDIPLALSAASREHLGVLSDRLAVTRAQAIVWPRGLGRRVFCLAAVESLDAFPLLITCMPEMLWAWHRHLDLLGRTGAITDPGADVRVLPYTVVPQVELGAPSALILDDLDVALRRDPATVNALRRLDGGVDTLRLACSTSLPENHASLVGYFSVLRPVEFRGDLPPAVRYPAPVGDHLRHHTGIYTLAPPTGPVEAGFRRSQVEVVDMSSELQRAQEALESVIGASSRLRRERVELLLRWSEEGRQEALSPKLSRAIALVRAHTNAGRTVTVLAGSERSAGLVRALARSKVPHALRVQVGVPARGQVCDSDVVVVLAAVRSYDVLDDFVVEASDTRGPRLVVVLHVRGIEDRLAVVTALRAERRRSVDPSSLLEEHEIDYVLGHTEALPTK